MIFGSNAQAREKEMQMKAINCFVFLILAIFLLATPAGGEEIENFCHDPEALAEWEVINEKYPRDLNVQTLHALRIGLCEKIDRGDIGVADGIAIFESMRQAVLSRVFQRQMREKGEDSL